MDADKINRWLTLGANLAVLASIVFLAVEIRQNTEMTRAQMTQGRTQNAMYLAEIIVSSEYIPDIYVKLDKGEELTPAEVIRFRVLLRALLRNQDNNIQQYNQGLLGDHMPRAVRAVVRSVIIDDPEGRAFWERGKQSFSDDFISFVDAIIAEADSAPQQ